MRCETYRRANVQNRRNRRPQMQITSFQLSISLFPDSTTASTNEETEKRGREEEDRLELRSMHRHYIRCTQFFMRSTTEWNGDGSERNWDWTPAKMDFVAVRCLFRFSSISFRPLSFVVCAVFGVLLCNARNIFGVRRRTRDDWFRFILFCECIAIDPCDFVIFLFNFVLFLVN